MTKQSTSFRLDEELIARLDRAASELSKRTAGVEVGRSGVLRAAVLRGLDALEVELGLAGRQTVRKGRRP